MKTYENEKQKHLKERQTFFKRPTSDSANIKNEVPFLFPPAIVAT